MINKMNTILEDDFKEIYYKNMPNQSINDKLIDNIKDIIKIELFQ